MSKEEILDLAENNLYLAARRNKLEKEIEELKEENKKLRESLYFYTDELLYECGDDSLYPVIFNDAGKRARQTLKELER